MKASDKKHRKIFEQKDVYVRDETIGSLMEEYGPDWIIGVELDTYGCCGNCGSVRTYLYRSKMETDEELALRIKNTLEYEEGLKLAKKRLASDRKKQQEEKDRKEYARLKRKFEKKQEIK